MHDASPRAEFQALTRPHLPRLLRLGYRLTRTPADSEDLVQETLCRAWANRHGFQGSGKTGAWLCRILLNCFISRRRREKTAAVVGARDDLAGHLHDPGRLRRAADPESALAERRLSAPVTAALDGLEPTFRVVVELVDLLGFGYREAADELGIPVGTVMSRLHRARTRMRPHLVDLARASGLAEAAPAMP